MRTATHPAATPIAVATTASDGSAPCIVAARSLVRSESTSTRAAATIMLVPAKIRVSPTVTRPEMSSAMPSSVVSARKRL